LIGGPELNPTESASGMLFDVRHKAKSLHHCPDEVV
jgi:hypothetical protein